MQWYKDGVLIPAANDSFLVTSENGVYSLRVKADYACSPDTFWTDSVAVYRGQVRAQLWIDQQNGPKPLAVRLNASGSIGHLREWFVNDSLIGTDSLMNVVFDRRGRYALRLHLSDTVAGCTADTVVFITVFDSVTVLFPTVFSPNGDGLNDHYLPVLINANFVDLSIYNRWGELVYFGNGTPSGWDGMFKGQMAPAGGYVAVVRFAADVGEIGLKSSHFQLVR
jgi:gliding motility-associated-like protein